MARNPNPNPNKLKIKTPNNTMSYIVVNETDSEKSIQVNFDNATAVRLFDTSDADVKPENLDEGVIAYGKNGRIVGTRKA